MFYKDYFNKSVKSATEYKIRYLKYLLNDSSIYKFIQFNDNEEENLLKLESLKNGTLWFSYYRYLNDPTEYKIEYNIRKTQRNTNLSREEIEYLNGSMKEMYDVCCFSYKYNDYMWDIYANDGNGLCIVFQSLDLDMLYPIDYIEKKKIPFTNLIINSLNALDEGIITNIPMAVLPFVVKNPMNGYLNSTKENEIRMLYSFYSDKDITKGKLYPDIKMRSGYLGLNVPYDKVDLRLKKVIIGRGCSLNLLEKIIGICEDNDYDYEIK